MQMLKQLLLAVGIAAGAALSIATVAPERADAATAEDLNKSAQDALNMLYKTDPVAEQLSKRAKAVLVFPQIVKAGLVFGASYGEGVLLKTNRPTDYFNSFSGSWGLQIGAQSYGYALYLMTDSAVDYLNKTNGWEIGVGPTVVVVDKGLAENLSSTTLKDDAYAVIFDQKGLMAGVSIEGTKISRVKR